MKKILTVLLLCAITTVFAESHMEKVCHEVKGKQVCKNVKVHKKFEGTPIPDAPVKKKK